MGIRGHLDPLGLMRIIGGCGESDSENNRASSVRCANLFDRCVAPKDRSRVEGSGGVNDSACE